MSTQTVNPKIQALLERIRKQRQENPVSQPESIVSNLTSDPVSDLFVTTDKFGQTITYNSQQSAFLKLAQAGKDCVLIGSAGTGKTTCMKGTIQTLIQTGRIPTLKNIDHKHLKEGTPGVIVISYTRRAVNNIRKNLSQDLQDNCLTYHKLMEYAPVYFEVTDPETGLTKTTMRFEPSRNMYNPIPSDVRTIIIEESSMLSVDYYETLIRACPHNPQIIFLGDIYQLPPVFGSAILGYKLTELPVIELTEVYRQAMNSPIISYAHKIKNGDAFPASEKLVTETPEGKVTLHPWKKKLHPENACELASRFLIEALKAGVYDPEEDMILIPFNKGYGTIELNKYLATALARKQKAVVYEIISGFLKVYLRVGEKVMFDREDAIVTAISRNGGYYGKAAQPESIQMDYWGAIHESDIDDVDHHTRNLTETNDFDVDALLEGMASGEEKVNQASHIITLQLLDSGREVTLNTTGELNNLLLGYALTVHKAQGSEWNKVFLLFHQSHATMLSRELLYTAMTRAKQEVYCICEKETFVTGVKSQRIKGTTLAEKAEYFKGKKESEVRTMKGNM